jgi:uncharacterized membrane protein
MHVTAGAQLPSERNIMGIGINSFLMAVGAILTFAVEATVAGINIKVVGVILMIAGALGLILTLAVFAPRRRLAVTETNRTRAVTPVATSSTVTTEDVSGTPIL